MQCALLSHLKTFPPLVASYVFLYLLHPSSPQSRIFKTLHPFSNPALQSFYFHRIVMFDKMRLPSNHDLDYSKTIFVHPVDCCRKKLWWKLVFMIWFDLYKCWWGGRFAWRWTAKRLLDVQRAWDSSKTALQAGVSTSNQLLLVYQIRCGYRTLAGKIRPQCRTSVSLRPACWSSPS